MLTQTSPPAYTPDHVMMMMNVNEQPAGSDSTRFRIGSGLCPQVCQPSTAGSMLAHVNAATAGHDELKR